jgi:hypothetical protein
MNATSSNQNPLAAPVYSGLNPLSGPADFTYSIDIPIVHATTDIFSGGVQCDTSAPFHWMGIVINSFTSVQFSVRFGINGTYYISDNQLLAANYVSDPSAPYTLVGQLIVPAGGRITVDLTNMSGANNTIEILCRGVKLFAGSLYTN